MRVIVAAASLLGGTHQRFPCVNALRPSALIARTSRRICRLDTPAARAASDTLSSPAATRSTAVQRFHCHSAILCIPGSGPGGGHYRCAR